MLYSDALVGQAALRSVTHSSVGGTQREPTYLLLYVNPVRVLGTRNRAQPKFLRGAQVQHFSHAAAWWHGVPGDAYACTSSCKHLHCATSEEIHECSAIINYPNQREHF